MGRGFDGAKGGVVHGNPSCISVIVGMVHGRDTSSMGVNIDTEHGCKYQHLVLLRVSKYKLG